MKGLCQTTALDTAYAYYNSKARDQKKYCMALKYFEKAMQKGELANYPMYSAAQSACQCNSSSKAFQYFKQAFSKTVDFYNHSYFANDTLNKCFSGTKEWKALMSKMKVSFDSVETIRLDYLNGINDTTKRLNQSPQYTSDFLSHTKDMNTSEVIAYIQSTAFRRPPKTGHWTLYRITNTHGKDVPFLLYIPTGYNQNKETSLFIYLHGAVSRKSYSSGVDLPTFEKDVLSPLIEKNTFILYPFAKNDFNWVDNVSALNLITEQIKFVKQLYRINDNKVFIGGHSDGARGMFWFSLYHRTRFAGFCGFSLSPSLHLDETKLSNLKGQQPLLSINGVKDQIFKYSKIKTVYDSSKQLQLNWHMESISADHNFMGDFPDIVRKAYDTLMQFERNVTPKTVVIEPGSKLPIQNLWLQVTEGNLDNSNIEATYSNNEFKVTSSGIKSFSLLIPYKMVDYKRSIQVLVNGKLIRKLKLKPDINTITSNFLKTADRKQIIANEIKVDLL